MVKVRSLESVPFSRIYVYVMYYVYVTPGPSLLIESTDSMISIKSSNQVTYTSAITCHICSNHCADIVVKETTCS